MYLHLPPPFTIIKLVLLTLQLQLQTIPILTLSPCKTSGGTIPINYPFALEDSCGSPQFRHMFNCTTTGLFFQTPSRSYEVQSIDYTKQTMTLYDPSMLTRSITPFASSNLTANTNRVPKLQPANSISPFAHTTVTSFPSIFIAFQQSSVSTQTINTKHKLPPLFNSSLLTLQFIPSICNALLRSIEFGIPPHATHGEHPAIICFTTTTP